MTIGGQNGYIYNGRWINQLLSYNCTQGYFRFFTREATKIKEIALSIAKTKGISNLEAWPEAISIYKLKYENYFE